MYRISNKINGLPSGVWSVLPGEDHTPGRLDNPNLFLPTLAAARKRVRELNK